MMESYYLVIFKTVEGQEFNNYSFLSKEVYKDLNKQGAVLHAIKAEKRQIYDKDYIRQLLAEFPNKKVKLDLD